MTGYRSDEAQAVEQALGKLAWPIERRSARAWAFTLVNGAAHDVHVGLADDWLVLETSAGAWRAALADPWSLVELNTGAGPLCKVIVSPRTGELMARAEIPMDAEGDLLRRLREACTGLGAALDALAGREPHDEPPATVTVETCLADLCRASGWTFRERAPGVHAATVGDERDACDVRVEAPRGRVRASVDLTAPGVAWTPESRRALAAFLLTAASGLRLARPFAQHDDRSLSAGFEVVLGAPASQGELARALSALWVAFHEHGRPARAIANDVVAKEYWRTLTTDD